MAKETTDAATIETERLPATITVEDIGPCRKKIAIEVPADVVGSQIGDSLGAIVSEAQLPGFRKGKAPAMLVRKKFGDAINGEAKNAIVQASFQQAVEEHKLRIVGDPIAEGLADITLVEGEPLKFEVDVEVSPEFDLPELEGIAIDKPTFEVSDEMVQKEVEKLCTNEGELEERENPEPGDYITGLGIMTGTPEGESEPKEFYNIDGAVVQMPTADKEGRGMILGVLVEDFAAQLGTPKRGETITIKAKGPEQHERDELRGVDLTVTFAVKDIQRIIPASIEEVVQRYGFQFADDLRETIRTRLSQNSFLQQLAAQRSQAADYLIEHTSFDLPERLTERQSARLLERRRMELLYRGVDEAEVEEHMAELRASSTEQAQRELKLYFILDRVAEQLEVTIDEAELNARIYQLAAQQRVRPEKMRQELIARRQIPAIYQQIREHKTLDALVKKAVVTDVTADEFKAKQEAKQGAKS